MTLDRTKYIGGSDVAAILGVSPWQSAFMLYQKKLGLFEEVITPAKQKLFDRGHRWEPIVVEMLVDELENRGHDVQILAQGQRYTDPEYDFLAAEIDVELLVDGEEVNGEAKTVNPFAIKLWGEDGTDDVPIYYAAQAMHGLMIKPRRRAVVAALTGFDDAPRVHWLNRDEETIAAIRAKELEFWAMVQSQKPPAPATLEDLKFLHAKDSGAVMEADDELHALCLELATLKEQGKNTDAAIEYLATKIKLQMGDNATLLHQGLPIATWKSTKPGTKTDWEAVAKELNATPQIIKAHTKATESQRRFLLK